MEKIRLRFGEKIAELVDGCTETDIQPKPPWRQRKERYIENIKSASPSVRLISCADKLHNAASILAAHRMVGEMVWGRFKVEKSETLWFYSSMVEALRAAGENRPILNELEVAVKDLQNLSEG